LSEQQRHLLGHGRASAEVGDVGDVDTGGDDQLHDAVAQQVAGGGHRDGPHPGDLAQLVTDHGASGQRLEVDPHQQHGAYGAGVPHRATTGGGVGHARQAVEGVGLSFFVTALGAGGRE
jgi:hypothetical protein